MSGQTPKGIVADTSYPGAAGTREETAPKNWSSGSFLWDEDVLFAWRALAVFGALLFLMGWLFWLGAAGYGDFTLGPFVALIALGFFGAAFAAAVGRTEVALALLAEAVVAGAIAIFDPPSLLSSPDALFNGSSAVASDLASVLSLWAVGATLLAIGGTFAVRTARQIDDDM